MYPPVVSLDGFANIDRGMFRAVSNLTEDLECCKEQVRSGLLYNSFKINLQIWGGVLESLRLDRLMYCTGTFTHISVSVFVNGRPETRSTGDFMSFTAQSANIRREALHLRPRDILYKFTFYKKNFNGN